MDAVRKTVRQRKQFEASHGSVKETISIEVNGTRFVGAGKSVYYSDTWRTFHDFLNGYMAARLGKDWGDAQVALPIEQQHPVVQWHTHLSVSQASQTRDSSGMLSLATGAAIAWLRLAYDLYLIDRNATLQRKLIRRIREVTSFQGARFEAAVAAMMLTVGYELAFANEQGPGKHPEFFATHRKTGAILAVEAKSRHRDGIMGHMPNVAPEPPTLCSIDRLLSAALQKECTEPLLVFIELNCPAYSDPSEGGALVEELQESWSRVQKRDWPNGFPGIGVVFYNDVAPWFLCDELRNDIGRNWVVVLWPEHCRYAFDVQPLLKELVVGCAQRSSVPMDFPRRNEAT